MTEVLQVVHKKSFIDEGDKKGWYDLELTRPFLDSKGLLDHIVIHQPRGDELRRLIKRSSIYDTNNLTFKDLDIELNHPWDLDEDFVWTSHPLWVKWHFEHCRFQPSNPNMGSVVFGWHGNFRFHKNEFDFGDSRGMRSWVFAFRQGSRVLLQGNDFKDSHLQFNCFISWEVNGSQELSWERRTARIVKDSSYYETMIRQKYEIPDTIRLHMPHSSSAHFGLDSLSFLGNKGIDRLQMDCRATHYDFRGMNRINSLWFSELRSGHHDDPGFELYLGSREEIDPHYSGAHSHRSMFLKLREIAIRRQDFRIANNIDKQIDRIDYYLTKEQKVSIRADWRGWVKYRQDRFLYEWRKFSSDFHRSWLRPLLMGLTGYCILNALPFFWIERFSSSDYVSLLLRSIDRFPFFMAELEDMYGHELESLSLGIKSLLMLSGLFQVIWIAMCGFAFRNSIRR